MRGIVALFFKQMLWARSLIGCLWDFILIGWERVLKLGQKISQIPCGSSWNRIYTIPEFENLTPSRVVYYSLSIAICTSSCVSSIERRWDKSKKVYPGQIFGDMRQTRVPTGRPLSKLIPDAVCFSLVISQKFLFRKTLTFDNKKWPG